MTREEKLYIKLLGITSKRYNQPDRIFYHWKNTADKMTCIALIEDSSITGTKRVVYEIETLVGLTPRI